MRKITTVFLLLILFLPACVKENAILSEKQKSGIEDSVSEAFEGLVVAAKSLDVDRYIEFFDKERFTSLNEDGAVFHSLDEFKNVYKGGISTIEKYKSLEFSKVKITVVDKNTAILVNEFKAKVVLKSGEVIPVSGAGDQVWSKTKSDWKLVSVSSSSSSPSEAK